MDKLKKCEGLSDGWSGENSKAINSNILSKAQYLIDTLAIRPDIYPPPRGTIQFERNIDSVSFFTEKKDRIRLISARQADKDLREKYYDYFKKINS